MCEATQAPEGADAMARRRAAGAAGHAGDTARAQIYIDDDEPAVRASALRALQRAGGLETQSLVAALEDPAPEVRITALELAAGRRDVPVGPAAARLGDCDHRVVEAAAWTCGEKVSTTGAPTDPTPTDPSPTDPTPTDPSPTDPTPVVEVLARMARSHSDPLCRESAIAALGAIAHPGGLSAVIAGLDDRPEVRRRAVIALAPFDGPEAEAALARAGTDRDRQVRAAAAELRGPSADDRNPSG